MLWGHSGFPECVPIPLSMALCQIKRKHHLTANQTVVPESFYSFTAHVRMFVPEENFERVVIIPFSSIRPPLMAYIQHKDTLYRACWSNFNFITFFLEFLRKKVSGNPTHVGIWCWFVTTLGIREFTRYLCGICGTRQTALGFPFPFREVTF